MPNLINKLCPWIAAALSGLILALCYAPWDVGLAVWFWQWPLLAALWFVNDESMTMKQKIRRGFFLGYLCGFVFFFVNSHWIFHTGKVVGMDTHWDNKFQEFIVEAGAGLGAIFGMGLYLGLYIGLFGIFAATIGKLDLPPVEKLTKKEGKGALLGKDLFGQSWAVIKCAFLNAACWCGLEWIRAVAFTGYSWNSLGVALKDHLMLVQFADTIGQLGYGFVVMFCGIVGYATILRFAREVKHHQTMRPHLDFAVAIGMLIALFLYGFGKVTERPEKTIDLNIRIIQMNTPIEDKYSPDVNVRRKIIWDYRDLTRAFVESADYDMVMWPETALPTVFSWQSTFDFLDNEVLQDDDFYLLMGIEENDVERRLFNTITMIKGKAENFQMYSKIHLVPFGEYVPGREWKIPVFAWFFGRVITQDFSRGEEYNVLYMEKDGQKVGIMPLVCFEDTVARHARKFVKPEPQFMANVTNDAWFYDSAEPQQHFSTALFRCIELRRPMVRAANTGVSGFIDETGSIYDKDSPGLRKRIIQDEVTGDTFIRGSINEILKVDANPPMTVYAKIGDTFSVIMGLIASGFFIWWLVKEKRKTGEVFLPEKVRTLYRTLLGKVCRR